MSQVLIERRGGTTIRYTGIPLPELPNAMRAAVNAAMEKTFSWWRRVIGPKHFLEGAHSWYGSLEERVFERRTPRYNRRKERVKGHTLPLVYSGDVRDEFLRGMMVTRTNKAGAVKGTAVWPNLPRYTYQERSARAPRKHAELTMMNEDDVQRVTNAFRRYLDEALEAAEKGNAQAARAEFAA